MQIAYNRYGGIFRHIYYDYLYRKNFNSNYWDYYICLIDSVIGNIGIEQFVNDFLRKEQLKDNVYSNIIMMYEFEDNDIKKRAKRISEIYFRRNKKLYLLQSWIYR